jgi:hypothetical protein
VVARVLIEEIGRGKVVWERERGEAWKKRGPLINVFSKEGSKKFIRARAIRRTRLGFGLMQS